MLRWIILRKLDGVERELGESVDYLRHIVRHSIGAFLKFAKIMPLNDYRKQLPTDAWHVARIVATRDADCGPCTQIEINLARKDGVDSTILQSIIDDQPDKLPPSLGEVYRFTQAVLKDHPEADQLRESIRQRFGERGLIELSLAVAACRVFPTTKRMLGFATACAATRLRA